MSGSPTLKVLLVEDNPGDVVMFREAVADARLLLDLCVARNGREAMDRLLGRGPWGDAPRPDVIVLDLNMPVMGGKEVLTAMRDDPKLSSIPVAVLTTSRHDRDVCQRYCPGRCIYLVKPTDYSLLVEALRQIEMFARSLLA